MRGRGRGCEGRAPVCMVIDICVTLRAPEMQPSAPRVAIYVYGMDWQGFSQVYTVGVCLVWCWSGGGWVRGGHTLRRAYARLVIAPRSLMPYSRVYGVECIYATARRSNGRSVCVCTA